MVQLLKHSKKDLHNKESRSNVILFASMNIKLKTKDEYFKITSQYLKLGYHNYSLNYKLGISIGLY